MTRAIAGVDEVGRGPLAGPVVAAAIVFHARIPPGITDSKALSARQRAEVLPRIVASAHVGIGMASVEEIDGLNILRATLLAMTRAVDALRCAVDHVLVDGNRLPDWRWRSTAIIGGDAREPVIAAASIIAKEHRDALMRALHAQHPAYGWEQNMGYGTPMHLEALQRHGATPHHRRSFAPVRSVCA